MSVNSVSSPFPIFTDVDGNPLEDGYIYIGDPNLNPEIAVKTAYWDSSLTVAAAQPIRTIGGYPSRGGAAARIYTSGDYSITVRNKNETLVYNSPVETAFVNTNKFSNDFVNDVDDFAALQLIDTDYATSVNLKELHVGIAESGGNFIYDATINKNTANGGTVVDASVSLAVQGTGIGLGCFIRQYNNHVNVKWFGAAGDGVTDDTSLIQKALTYMEISKSSRLVGAKGETYLVSATLRVPPKTTFDGNWSTLKADISSFARGTLQSLTALIANKNADFVLGEAIDDGIEICNFYMISGSNIAMDTVYLANTNNAHIHDLVCSYQQAATYTLSHVDLHHTNTNALVENCILNHVSATHSFGACASFRNSNSLVKSSNNTIRNCYLYKNGTSNNDEHMWINGATGEIEGSRVINNTFVSETTDSTTSVLTVYPSTNGGAITTSEVKDTVISENHFLIKQAANSILLGITGETKPARGVTISSNTFRLRGGAAIKTILNDEAVLIDSNICYMEAGNKGNFLSIDSTYTASTTIIASNNVLKGEYTIAFFGGYIRGNTCEHASTFASECLEVTSNKIYNAHYAFFYSSLTTAVVKDNNIRVDTFVDDGSTLPYIFYVNGLGAQEIARNYVFLNATGVNLLRTPLSAADKVYLYDNIIEKDAAVTTPSCQQFSLPLGTSHNNILFGLNTSAITSSGSYGVSGFVPAVGMISIYTDVVAGAGTNAAQFRNSAGATLKIQTTLV